MKSFSDSGRDELIVITGAGVHWRGLGSVFRAPVRADSCGRQKAAFRLVSDRPRRGKPLPGREPGVRLHAGMRRRGKSKIWRLMGGMGFIERFRVQCLRSVLINTHMIEAAYRAGEALLFLLVGLRVQHRIAKRRQLPRLERDGCLSGDGGARLRLGKADSEVCQEYWAERGMKTFIARFHNVYAAHPGGSASREGSPAAYLPQGH